MNFLKQNWFKVGLLIISSVFVLLYGLNQYIALNSHNLRVTEQIGNCGQLNIDKEAHNSCVDRVKSFIVLPALSWHPIDD